jgi:plastocyanin
MRIILLVAVFLMICSISYIQPIAVAQLDLFTITINPGASDGDSQNPIEPANITIPTGATVIWLNNDSVYHQIVSGTSDKGPTNIFYGDFFGPNESYNVTFDTAGVFDYYDPIWTNIKGQVVVISENNTASLNTNNSNSNSVQPTNNAESVQNDTNTLTETDNMIQTQPQVGIIGENPVTPAPDQQQQQQPVQQQQQFEQPIQEQQQLQPVQQQQQFEQPIQEQQQLQPVQQQQQFQIPQHGDIDSFKATGTIHSYIVTPTSPWNATGEWTLIVEDGEVNNFITNMAWFNGTSGHTHDFLNFESSGDIELPADNIVTIEGEMDVASNGVVTWDEVESSINIGGGGRTITINVDHEQTDHHFAGQPVVGTINSLTPCSDSPGPSMEILPTCS